MNDKDMQKNPDGLKTTEKCSSGKKTAERPVWIRVVCIIVIVLLIGLIIATLIAAIAGADKDTIMALLLCDGIIPIFIWVFLKITKKSMDRKASIGAQSGAGQEPD